MLTLHEPSTSCQRVETNIAPEAWILKKRAAQTWLYVQGLTLAKPEMVPFRLTQNIIDAFGVSGHEGAYRRVCEITLRVLREHREVIIV